MYKLNKISNKRTLAINFCLFHHFRFCAKERHSYHSDNMTPRLLKNNESHLNYNIILAIGILFIHTEAQQIPLVRLPSNTLLKYTAYKDVSILHFRIPSDTRTAYFSFKAYEEVKSAFRKFRFFFFFIVL